LLFLIVYSLAGGAKRGESGRFSVGPWLDLHFVAVAEALDELTQSAQADGKALMTALQGTRIERSVVMLH
jgi:hypothetical protein